MGTDLNAVLDDLRARRAALDAAIASLEQLVGLGFADVPGAGVSGSAGATTAGKTVEPSQVPGDAFFGLSIVEAAKRYLAMVRRKQSARDIADALERGGITHTSKDFRQTVYSVMAREMKEKGDLVRLPDGEWGLSDWYPGMRRGAKAKPADELIDDAKKRKLDDGAE